MDRHEPNHCHWFFGDRNIDHTVFRMYRDYSAARPGHDTIYDAADPSSHDYRSPINPALSNRRSSRSVYGDRTGPEKHYFNQS